MFTPEAMASYAVAALFTVINLVVSYLILKRFLFKPILGLLRKRKEEVEQGLSKTEEQVSKAQDKLKEADLRIEKSSTEAAEILHTARLQAQEQKDTIVADAKKEAIAIVAKADAEKERMRLAMVNEIKDEVTDLSVAIASKIIGRAMDDSQRVLQAEQFLDEHLAQTNDGHIGGES